ncbi:hypothetical protein KY289_001163 [Solanum tuberosum]|nr:hypothetical protein KY289_001163 [Solanum tuberosum]
MIGPKGGPGTSVIFLISKRSALFDLLESFLTTKSPKGLRASQLACRDGDAEYSLLVNLKRLDDDLQLSRQISIESLHNDLAETAPRLSSSGKSPRTIFIFLISTGSALFDPLESFLTTKSPKDLRASQLARRESNPCIIHGVRNFGVLIRYMQRQQLPVFGN